MEAAGSGNRHRNSTRYNLVDEWSTDTAKRCPWLFPATDVLPLTATSTGVPTDTTHYDRAQAVATSIHNLAARAFVAAQTSAWYHLNGRWSLARIHTVDTTEIEHHMPNA